MADAPLEQRAAGLVNVREIRTCPGEFELRESPNGTGGSDLIFSGFASVTNFDYQMEDFAGEFTERVAPNAFKRTIAEGCDTAFLLNHSGMTLSRTRAGTMTLSEVTTGSPTGLFVEARLDTNNLYVQALRSGVERGDISEMSMAFRVPKNGQMWSEDYTDRTITECNLNYGDVSAVNFGANPGTQGHVGIRSHSGDDAARLDVILTELRAGRPLSDDTRAILSQVSELLSAPAVDEMIEELTEPSPASAASRALAELLVRRNREGERKRRA